MLDVTISVLSVVGFWAIWRVVATIRGFKSVSNLPGVRCLFEPFTPFGALMPAFWGGNIGLNFQWQLRRTLYLRSDTISIVPYLAGEARLWTANFDVARQVIAGGPSSVWTKPKEFTKAILLWGMNLAAAEGGNLWRRHRRIMGPAFNNKTYTLVWDETRRVYKDMVADEGWLSRSIIDIPIIQKYTLKLALFVISQCGFGLPFTWNAPPMDKDGSMSLQEALRVVSGSNLTRANTPRWVQNLPIKKFQYIDLAFKTLDAFMRQHVARRKLEIRQELIDNGGDDVERSDVFSRLVLANESETEKLPLDDEELIGNTFVLLFAGHETTGHTLAATLGFLGLYQEEQDIVYEQIMSVVGNDRDPTFEDYAGLYKVLAAFYEALRLIPSAAVMIRETTKDTTLSIPNTGEEGGVREIFMAKGSVAFVDLLGIQYNPRYFPDPHAYKPSRWYAQETSDVSDAFTAFSFGPRGCIGRKFATTEAVCWLTMLLRDFKIEVVLGPGESREQWRERALSAEILLTLGIKSLPLRLVRRPGTGRDAKM